MKGIWKWYDWVLFSMRFLVFISVFYNASAVKEQWFIPFSLIMILIGLSYFVPLLLLLKSRKLYFFAEILFLVLLMPVFSIMDKTLVGTFITYSLFLGFYGEKTFKRWSLIIPIVVMLLCPLPTLLSSSVTYISVLISGFVFYGLGIIFNSLIYTKEELSKKNAIIEEQYKALAQMEESKKRMLADISHDLKTPVTTIQGYSKSLYEGMVSDKDQQKKYLKYIHDKSVRVASLIDELFMFSKLDNPEFSIHREESDICEFIREVIVEYYHLFDEKNMNVSIDIPKSKIFYHFDRQLFYRVISNILENALKYNPENTNILIKLRKSTSHIEIEMADSGVTIPEDVAEHIFEPFFRGDKNRTENSGSGLGLSISRKIVELHHGKIYLDTKLQRWEKRFLILLPIETTSY